MWWDGFRQADGTVRQFFLTADEKRDVASLVIGKENTVPAFGFAFFEPIKQRAPYGVTGMQGAIGPVGHPVKNYLSGGSGVFGISGPKGVRGFSGSRGISGQSVGSAGAYYAAPAIRHNYDAGGDDHPKVTCSLNDAIPDMALSSMVSQDAEEKTSAMMDLSESLACVKEVSVGAGAEITQELRQDSLEVSEWKPKAAAVIRLYFVFKDEFKAII